MWGTIIQIGIIVGIYLYNHLTEKSPKPPKPLGLDLPQTDENTQVPYVVGRWRVKAPILAWTSNLHTACADNNNNGSQYIVYGLDMMFVVGIPMGTPPTMANRLDQFTPRLHTIWAGDLKLPRPATGCLPAHAPGDSENPPQCAFVDSQFVVQESALGGPGNGGGFLGTYSWFPGCSDQTFDETVWPIAAAMALDGLDQTKQPGYRRMMCCGFSNADFPSTLVIPNTTTSFPLYDGQPGQAGSTIDPFAVTGRFANVPQPRQGFVLGESSQIPGISLEVSAYGREIWEP